MPKSTSPKVSKAPEEFTPPPPSLSLRGDDIKKYLGKMPAYDEMVTLDAKFRVKEVKDGEDWEGDRQKEVVLELASSDESSESEEAKDGGEGEVFDMEDDDADSD